MRDVRMNKAISTRKDLWVDPGRCRFSTDGRTAAICAYDGLRVVDMQLRDILFVRAEVFTFMNVAIMGIHCTADFAKNFWFKET